MTIKTALACAADVRRATLPPSIELISTKICEFYNIDLAWLIATKRGTLNWPRLVFMHVSRNMFGHTLRAISEPLGCLHRSTVSTGIHQCEKMLQRNPKMEDEILTIYHIVKDAV